MVFDILLRILKERMSLIERLDIDRVSSFIYPLTHHEQINPARLLFFGYWCHGRMYTKYTISIWGHLHSLGKRGIWLWAGLITNDGVLWTKSCQLYLSLIDQWVKLVSINNGITKSKAFGPYRQWDTAYSYYVCWLVLLHPFHYHKNPCKYLLIKGISSYSIRILYSEVVCLRKKTEKSD